MSLISRFRAKQCQRRNARPTQRQVKLLLRLTPAEQEIIDLVDFNNRSIVSVATILGISPVTAEWRYRKAHWHLLAIV